MPLASLFNLQFYGPASGAAVVTVSPTESITLKGLGSAAATESGLGTVFNADATRLKNSPATITSLGQIVTANPKGRARPTATVSIGARPSAFDIAQAVWLQQIAAVDVAGTTAAKLNDSGGGGGGGGTIIREDELAQGGTKAQITLNAAASSTDNLYEEAYVVLISGTGAGQVRKIKAYYGATRTCVVWNHFQVAPDSTTVYRIIP